MPFAMKNPSFYISALKEESTKPLHIGLYWGDSISDAHARDMVALAKAMHQTTRTIKFFWLRFNDGDERVRSVFSAFGKELIGAKSIASLVLEDTVGITEIQCLRDFLVQNDTLRGVKFLRTNLGTSSFSLLRDFFIHNSALRVLDLSSNPRVGDETIREILCAVQQGEPRLEVLNIGESNIDGNAVSSNGISEDGVEFIAKFVSKSKSLVNGVSDHVFLLLLQDLTSHTFCSLITKSPHSVIFKATTSGLE